MLFILLQILLLVLISFQFSLDCIFQDLFGWDYSKHLCTDNGGIIGHLRAFYGTTELMERAQLHGHFLIWLDGGLNPSDVHQKMRESSEWTEKYFRYWEDVIYHHVPEAEGEVPKNFEPRTQRPLNPEHPNFGSEFVQDVRNCAEILQKHVCRNVCHKCGHPNDCRFLFPHQCEPKSYFDEISNSVVMKCLDGNVNYYNCHLLTSVRHNHDIKNILSGKSAKAAMFYITDYITKNDEKLHQILALLSRAVAATPIVTENMSSKDHARLLILKCLTAMMRNQRIHGQQAARYLRNTGDTMPSHKTKPMLSSTVVRYVTMCYNKSQTTPPAHKLPLYEKGDAPSEYNTDQQIGGVEEDEESDIEDSDPNDEVDGTGDFEPEHIKLYRGKDGQFYQCSQLDDYLYRDKLLAHVPFYDFICRFRKERKGGSFKEEDGQYRRFFFLQQHKEHHSHMILETIRESNACPKHEIVPRVVGTSIPRRESDPENYFLFMLAHFCPFSADHGINFEGGNLEAIFHTKSFSLLSKNVMQNWEAVHECEDAREKERIRKQGSSQKKSSHARKEQGEGLPKEYLLDPDSFEVVLNDVLRSRMDTDSLAMETILRGASWISYQDASDSSSIRDVFSDPFSHGQEKYPFHCLKLWQDEIKHTEQMITHARHARDDPNNQVVMKGVCEETSNSVNFDADLGMPVVPKTMVNLDIQISGDFDGKVMEVIEQFKLNKKQQIAFHIGAQRFKELLEIDVRSGNGTIGRGKPLHMLMTGPGGTGKTHVVKALKELMKMYGSAHRIRFLAPTGTAAALIDGQTIHSALGIPVHLTNAEMRDLRDSNGADLYMRVSVKHRAELREEWKNVYFILIDEVSMVSQELLCEIDIVLRDVASCPNDWFGGVNIIFAGDFYQHKPVKQCALYSPIPCKPNKIYSQMEDVARYGRLVWKSVDTVVELTEQKRMQGDPEYALACQHLQIHNCDFDDMNIFNSCLVKSPSNPLGVDLKIYLKALSLSIRTSHDNT